MTDYAGTIRLGNERMLITKEEAEVLKNMFETNGIPYNTLKNNRVGKGCMTVYDVFNKYQQHIYKQIKKSEKDYVKECFAKTELFDISSLNLKTEYDIPASVKDGLVIGKIETSISLPFENCFIKVYDDAEESNGVFIKEYDPEHLTGAVLIISRRFNTFIEMTFPFTINLNSMSLVVETKHLDKSYIEAFHAEEKMNKEETEFMYKTSFKDIAMIIKLAMETLDRLNRYVILTDRTDRKEYYARKGKPTIKLDGRPIYYVMEKKVYERKEYNIKPITKLEYSYSFHVRGHWRKLSEEQTGKNRQGIYNVKGYTWVKDFIKGEGELVKRVRIVK